MPPIHSNDIHRMSYTELLSSHATELDIVNLSTISFRMLSLFIGVSSLFVIVLSDQPVHLIFRWHICNACKPHAPAPPNDVSSIAQIK